MSLAFNEFGQPILILQNQQEKVRQKGPEAYKANILAASAVAKLLRTSLGPKGMDKLVVSPDGDVLITNDGATIMEKIELNHQTAKLLVELSKSQDNEIGDGTTGVVVIAGALLDQAQLLIEKGLHPLKITSGFEKSCEIAMKTIDKNSIDIDIQKNENEALVQCAMTALGSKIVSKFQNQLAKIAVKAILSVADLERRDVIFDLIKISTKTGGSLEDTKFVDGIVLDKEFSHSQMRKEVNDAKICLLTCPFEPPKPKTKHNLEIKSSEDYAKLYKIEQTYFTDMIKKIKDSKANLVLCQWGFDDEANHLLMQNHLPSVRWVGGVEVEQIALATGARIIPRFSEIDESKLGKAKLVKEETLGTTNDKIIVIEGCEKAKSVTIMIRGGSKAIVDEAQRSMHDAICVVRNMIVDPRVVTGGGSIELSCALEIANAAKTENSLEQYAMKGFADALEQIPYALAEIVATIQ